MSEAVTEALKAESLGEVPVGAVIVKDGAVIGHGHNLTVTLKDPTAHAEIAAIKDAAEKLGSRRLLGCDMYVTCEPCAMCAGAMVLSRMRKVYIGVMDPKSGACGSVFNIIQESRLNHRIEIETGALENECGRMLKDFFKKRRKNSTEEVST